jgi:adenosine/AMP kinase
MKSLPVPPHITFGVAFAETSGPCLIRYEGNDDGLAQKAAGIVQEIGAGLLPTTIHQAFPINVLNSIKCVRKSTAVSIATASPPVIVAEANGAAEL